MALVTNVTVLMPSLRCLRPPRHLTIFDNCGELRASTDFISVQEAVAALANFMKTSGISVGPSDRSWVDLEGCLSSPRDPNVSPELMSAAEDWSMTTANHAGVPRSFIVGFVREHSGTARVAEEYVHYVDWLLDGAAESLGVP